jgi:CBS domain-containing protein
MAGHKTSETLLGDFRTDARMLVLAALAVPGRRDWRARRQSAPLLIAEITNLVFFQRFSPVLRSLEHNHLGPWVILAPVGGALIIGLMARYGSEKIRGHGIPEALEAILLEGSLIQPKVALLKPISSAISIGTGGPFGAEGPIIMTGGALLDPGTALLCGSVAALAVTVLLLKRSILTEKLARRGQHIAREYSVDILELMRVRDVMETDVSLIPANTPLPRFAARVASGDPLICSHQGTLLGDEKGELAGIITRGDVVRAFDRSRDETLTVLAAGSTNLRIAYPDETLHDAVARMLRHDIGRLPVVERTNEKKVVGYLGCSAILAARERYHCDEEVRARGFRSNDEPITAEA